MDNRENIFVEYDLNCSDEIKTIWALPSIFYFLFDILFIEDEKFTFFDFVIDYTKNKNIPRHLSTKNYEKINKSGLNIRNPSNKSSIIPVVKQEPLQYRRNITDDKAYDYNLVTYIKDSKDKDYFYNLEDMEKLDEYDVISYDELENKKPTPKSANMFPSITKLGEYKKILYNQILNKINKQIGTDKLSPNKYITFNELFYWLKNDKIELDNDLVENLRQEYSIFFFGTDKYFYIVLIINSGILEDNANALVIENLGNVNRFFAHKVGNLDNPHEHCIEDFIGERKYELKNLDIFIDILSTTLDLFCYDIPNENLCDRNIPLSKMMFIGGNKIKIEEFPKDSLIPFKNEGKDERLTYIRWYIPKIFNLLFDINQDFNSTDIFLDVSQVSTKKQIETPSKSQSKSFLSFLSKPRTTSNSLPVVEEKVDFKKHYLKFLRKLNLIYRSPIDVYNEIEKNPDIENQYKTETNIEMFYNIEMNVFILRLKLNLDMLLKDNNSESNYFEDKIKIQPINTLTVTFDSKENISYVISYINPVKRYGENDSSIYINGINTILINSKILNKNIKLIIKNSLNIFCKNTNINSENLFSDYVSPFISSENTEEIEEFKNYCHSNFITLFGKLCSYNSINKLSKTRSVNFDDSFEHRRFNSDDKDQAKDLPENLPENYDEDQTEDIIATK